MTIEELYELIKSDESYRIERTISTGNMDKFQEAICAFANDLPGSRKKGYLLIGVHDDGSISGLKVDDTLMKKISGIRSDGNILPLPVMNTEKVETPQGDVLVVEVTPSFGLAEFDVNLMTVFLVKVKNAETLEANSVRQQIFDNLQPNLQPILQPSCNHESSGIREVGSKAGYRLWLCSDVVP